MTVSEHRLVVPEAPSELTLPSYARPQPGNHPPLDYAPYKATALRYPTRPLVLLPHRLTEVTGPLLGDDLITMHDADLTMQHGGEPQGQRRAGRGRPAAVDIHMQGPAETVFFDL
jgi:protocatechuate 3,4-dioxygenase beta subunit